MEKDKKFVDEVNNMNALITMHIDDMLTDEECNYYIELSNDNITHFFTALNNAICNKMIKTGMASNFLKAQHIYNELLVQYLLKAN
jgi:hypothetical protein